MSIFISRVQIRNFRNFKEVDVDLTHKQVVIGENGVGKSNFLRAIQLVLDPSFSDSDRWLSTSDFHDSIEKPMENGEVIEIALELKGYEKNAQLLVKFQDAVISDNPPTLRLAYKFGPLKDDEGRISGYQYITYLGNNEQYTLTPSHRILLNIKVIKALRDVEREMRALKKSPVFQLVNQYEIREEELNAISDELKDAAEHIMELEEILEIKDLIEKKFKALSGFRVDNTVNLSTFDIDPERLLHTLQILLGDKKRPVSEVSLGLCNILYITLMLLLMRDRTIPTLLKEEKYEELKKIDAALLEQFYKKGNKKNYILKKSRRNENTEALYTLMNKNYFPNQSFTILAVEEPEAHLHPILQRLIYREVLQKSKTSVIFTTHSTHLTSVAPIDTIVHIRQDNDGESSVTATAKLNIDTKDLTDMERYLDARRGELYFGKGVILVEGIAEEFLTPKFADLAEFSLDNNGIIVCNINSTNFKPYVQLLEELEIPWCLITDGDYYELDKDNNRIYHTLKTGAKHGYAGFNMVEKTLLDLQLIDEDDAKKSLKEKEELFKELGCFIGEYTLEVDIMAEGGKDGANVLKNVFSELRPGGARQQQNFEDLLDNGNYYDALNRIEMPEIGKGRFAQRLAPNLILKQMPPHVKKAIEYIKAEVQAYE